MIDYTIRTATAEDASLVRTLLQELADYEKLLHGFHLTEDDIRRDMLGAACNCELAFADGVGAGLVTWFWTYKSFRARRGVFVEDLFVSPVHRGQGLGRALLGVLAAQAREAGGFMEWQVLDWNAPSIEFYKELGATLAPEWVTCRLDGDALERLS